MPARPTGPGSRTACPRWSCMPVWHGSGHELGILDAVMLHSCAAANCTLPSDILSYERVDDVIVKPIDIRKLPTSSNAVWGHFPSARPSWSCGVHTTKEHCDAPPHPVAVRPESFVDPTNVTSACIPNSPHWRRTAGSGIGGHCTADLIPLRTPHTWFSCPCWLRWYQRVPILCFRRGFR